MMKQVKQSKYYRLMINGIALTDSTGRGWRYFNEMEKDTIVKEKSVLPTTNEIVIYEETNTYLVRE
jgi:hypothetical protein